MKDKRILKYFIPLFLLVFMIVNWDEASWIFNYRTVSGLFSDFLKPNTEQAQTTYYTKDPESLIKNQADKKEGSISIPKIGIAAPLVFAESSDSKDLEKALDFGVVHFPESALPGQPGQTILLGHSAPSGWPKIKHDWVFSDLNDLVEGDKIHVFFNNKRYEYSVVRKVFLERGEEISQESLTNNDNVVVLISCWPPGKDIRRIAVEAAIK